MTPVERNKLAVQKTRRLENSKQASVYQAILNSLSKINRSSIFFAVLTAFFLFSVLQIKLNFKRDLPAETQIRNLNVDAKLYYHLAQNIVNGTGYYCKIRNDEAMTSVGHPLLLAIFCVILKMSPATFTWFFFVISFILLSTAVWIYSRSSIILILAMWLYCGFFKHIEWLSGNVESSIIFANLLLVAVLTVFYKTGFSKRWAIASGFALFIHILMRPIFLFPTHFCLAGCIAAILYRYIKKHTLSPSQFVKGWLIFLIIAESLVLMTYAHSHLRYRDSRLVTGTYGVLALYAGNNIYLPTNHEFWAQSRYPQEFLKKIYILSNNPGMTWQQRHKILTQEVVSYWKQHPVRAIQGWWWRFGQFMGIYSGSEGPHIVLHTFSASALLILVVIRVFIGILQKKEKLKLKDSFGLVCATMFFMYSAIHAVFSYGSFRYAAVTLALLAPAVACLLYEIKSLLNRLTAVILTGLNQTRPAT
jgi:hypothetical protein